MYLHRIGTKQDRRKQNQKFEGLKSKQFTTKDYFQQRRTHFRNVWRAFFVDLILIGRIE